MQLYGFGECAEQHAIRLSYDVADKGCLEAFIAYVAPMLFVPVECWRDAFVSVTQLLIAIRRQLAGKPCPTLSVNSQPEA